jgi:hypothetical protein
VRNMQLPAPILPWGRYCSPKGNRLCISMCSGICIQPDVLQMTLVAGTQAAVAYLPW